MKATFDKRSRDKSYTPKPPERALQGPKQDTKNFSGANGANLNRSPGNNAVCVHRPRCASVIAIYDAEYRRWPIARLEEAPLDGMAPAGGEKGLRDLNEMETPSLSTGAQNGHCASPHRHMMAVNLPGSFRVRRLEMGSRVGWALKTSLRALGCQVVALEAIILCKPLLRTLPKFIYFSLFCCHAPVSCINACTDFILQLYGEQSSYK